MIFSTVQDEKMTANQNLLSQAEQFARTGDYRSAISLLESDGSYEDAELDKLIATSERRLVRGIAQLLERWKHPGDPLAASFILFNMVEGSVHAHVLGQPVVDDERFRKALTESVLKLARHG